MPCRRVEDGVDDRSRSPCSGRRCRRSRVTTSSRVGFGFSASSASAAMIMPARAEAALGGEAVQERLLERRERPSVGVVPSSVFTVAPLIVSTGTRQDITASPSSVAGAGAARACAQPRLAAVRPSVSRRALSSVVPGWARNSRGSPLSSSSMTLDGMGSLKARRTWTGRTRRRYQAQAYASSNGSAASTARLGRGRRCRRAASASSAASARTGSRATPPSAIRVPSVATVTIDALFCLRRIALRVEPALGDREGDARDEVAFASRSARRARAGRPRGRRAAAARTGCRRPSPCCGSWARRSTRSRRAGSRPRAPSSVSVVVAPTVTRRRRRRCPPEAGAAQADDRRRSARGAGRRAVPPATTTPSPEQADGLVDGRRERWTFIPRPPGCATPRSPRSRTPRRHRPSASAWAP